jgi:hypothetical protein
VRGCGGPPTTWLRHGWAVGGVPLRGGVGVAHGGGEGGGTENAILQHWEGDSMI